MHSLLWIDVNGLKSPDSGTVQVPSCNIGSGAVAKLPQVAAFKIEGSRAIEGRTLEQAQSQGRRQWSVYRVKVEIDVSVAGQRSTYVFNCIHSGQSAVIQPLGMR